MWAPAILFSIVVLLMIVGRFCGGVLPSLEEIDLSPEILGLPIEWVDSDRPILGASAAVVPGRRSGPPGWVSPLWVPIVSAFPVRSHFGEAEVGLCTGVLSERPVGGPPASPGLGPLFSPGPGFSR